MKNRLIGRQLLAGAAAVLALSTGIPVISASQYGNSQTNSSQISGSNTSGSSVDGMTTGNIRSEAADNAGTEATTGNSPVGDAAADHGSDSTAEIGTGNSTETDSLLVTDISAECDLSEIAPGTVEVSFETEDYYVATNAEIDINLIVKGGQDLGEFNLVLVYDDVRLEYISGGSYLTKGKIILNGQAESRAMKFNLKFRTNYNGNGGIYVRNAYFCSKDNSIEMTVPEKPGAAIAIVGLESTEQPDFSLQHNEQNYGLDTEIPLVGRVTWSDGSNQYIIDLSCYVPDVVDFNYTLSGDIFNDILLTMFKSQDGTVRLVYLMDQNKDLNLCAFNDGKMYPVTKNGGNYFLSAYAISEWPDGLTDEIVDKEKVFYMLNANGLGAFAKYYKNDIVSWEYKSQIEIVTTEEEEPFYTFQEDGKVTPKSFWKGFTSHIEISLLIFFVLIGLITLILRLLRGAVRGKKARKYKKNLPPEIPYDEEMKEQERIVREARLDEMKQERARIREERKAERAAAAEAKAAQEANEQATTRVKAEQAAKAKAEAEEKAEELRTAREKADRLYAKAKMAVKKARKEKKAADLALELAVAEKDKAEAKAAKVAKEAKAARIAAKKASRKKAAAEQATLDRTVKDGATGYLPNLADLDGDMVSSAEVAERIAAAKEATVKESAAKMLLEEAEAREAEARTAAAEAAEKEAAAVKKLASREASAKKAAAKEAAQEKVLRDLMSEKAVVRTEAQAEADDVAAKDAKRAAQAKKTKKAKAAKVTPEMEAEEAERIAREKAELKARVEAERIAWKAEAAELRTLETAEAERIARESEEAERIAWETAEAERIASEAEETERIASEAEEAKRLAREEAEHQAREAEEAERLAREEAEHQAREAEEAERLAQEEAERLAREEAEAARLAMEAEQRYAREAAIAEQRAWEAAEAERIAREEEEAEAAEHAEDPADEEANDPFAKLNELLTESSGKTKRNAKRKAGTNARTGRGRASAERLEMGTLSEDFNRTPTHQKSEFTMDLKRAIREFELDPEDK